MEINIFDSIEEICKEFNIDNTSDIESILKQLKEMQVSLHPDVNPDYETDENIRNKYFRLSEARNYIKNLKNTEQSMISISNIETLIKAINNHGEINNTTTKSL